MKKKKHQQQDRVKELPIEKMFCHWAAVWEDLADMLWHHNELCKDTVPIHLIGREARDGAFDYPELSGGLMKAVSADLRSRENFSL